MNQLKSIIVIVIFLGLAACVPTTVEDGYDFPTAPAVTVPATAVSTTAPIEPTPTLVVTTTPPAKPTPTKELPTAVPPTPMPPTSTPQNPPTRIQFEQGAISATLTGHIHAGQSLTFLAWAADGQNMSVELLSNNNVANFSVTGMSDGQPYKRLVNEDRLWQHILTISQDHLLTLHSLAATDYMLTLTIINPPDVLQPVWPVIDAEFGLILGGSHNGQWLDQWTVMESLQDVERDYLLHGIEGPRGLVAGSLPYVAVGPCPQPFMRLTPDDDRLRNGIATMATWEMMPRVAQPLPLDTAVYIDQIRTLLQDSGIVEPMVNLTGVYRIDLEGDGVDEVLIQAEHLTGLGQGLPTANAGDYTAVVLNKIIGGTVSSIPLQLDVYPEAAELVDPLQFQTLGFFDLDGNGRLEIVIEGFGYERRFVQVYESQATSIEVVMGNGCRQ